MLTNSTIYSYLIILSLPFFILGLKNVLVSQDEKKLDPELKKLALSITLFTVLFGIGIALG
jgi:1,4-dihydroxy-2-naphthoate octaprenyltransferase